MGRLRIVLLLLMVVAVVFFVAIGSGSLPCFLANVASPMDRCSGVFERLDAVPMFPPEGAEHVGHCRENWTETGCSPAADEKLIYLVTPTYSRREQVAELTRLAQTLMHVKNLHWVVAEDADRCSPLVESILNRFQIPFTHLRSPMPSLYKNLPRNKNPRGVSGRRAALKWILRRQAERRCDAVVYFADDDNVYDLDLFKELRKTSRVSVFPVGLIGVQSFSSPLVDGGGREVIGFSDPWFERRKFPIDMAGFAVSTAFVVDRGANASSMPYKAGFEEDHFLRSMNVEYRDLEPLADGCTRILVWHTKTVSQKVPKIIKPPLQRRRLRGGHNLEALLNNMEKTGLISTTTDERVVGHQIATCTDPEGCDTT